MGREREKGKECEGRNGGVDGKGVGSQKEGIGMEREGENGN